MGPLEQVEELHVFKGERDQPITTTKRYPVAVGWGGRATLTRAICTRDADCLTP